MSALCASVSAENNSRNVFAQRLREISIMHALGRTTTVSATDPAGLATTVSFRSSCNAARNCLINISNDHLIHVHTFAHDTNMTTLPFEVTSIRKHCESLDRVGFSQGGEVVNGPILPLKKTFGARNWSAKSRRGKVFTLIN